MIAAAFGLLTLGIVGYQFVDSFTTLDPRTPQRPEASFSALDQPPASASMSVSKQEVQERQKRKEHVQKAEHAGRSAPDQTTATARAPSSGQINSLGSEDVCPEDYRHVAGSKVYQNSCAACHGGAGPAQGPRWIRSKDIDTLIAHALNGFNAMPPKGGDASLCDARVIAAVVYMKQSYNRMITFITKMLELKYDGNNKELIKSLRARP